MRRRTMIQAAGAGAVLLGAGKPLSAYANSEERPVLNRSEVPLGVQLYTVRDQVRDDVRGTLADIAAIGYREVELFGLGGDVDEQTPLFGLSAPEFAAALADTGLRAPVAHIQGDAMNIAEIADIAGQVGVRHLVVPLAPEFVSFADGQFRMLGVTGRSQLDAIAERLNRQGELARASGMGFGYHNHQMEFADLARIRHQLPAADADALALRGRVFHMRGVPPRAPRLKALSTRFDILSSMPAPASSPRGHAGRRLDALATKVGDGCGLGDENAFDYLFSQADAELVKIELDIGWAVFAGVDVLAVLNRYAGRVLAVHLKDHAPPGSPADGAEPDPASIAAQLVEPGAGPTDFGPILAALDQTGVAHRFVEVDIAPEPIDAINRGYGYLSGL